MNNTSGSPMTLTREPHAAHTGLKGGWDLEWLTVEAPTRPQAMDIPLGFTYHSGNVSDGKQFWFYTREAPLSLGECGKCRLLKERGWRP